MFTKAVWLDLVTLGPVEMEGQSQETHASLVLGEDSLKRKQNSGKWAGSSFPSCSWRRDDHKLDPENDMDLTSKFSRLAFGLFNQEPLVSTAESQPVL